jgi:hypothetical protein
MGTDRSSNDRPLWRPKRKISPQGVFVKGRTDGDFRRFLPMLCHPTSQLLLLGGLGSLEAVPVYAELPYFGFECLSGNAQFNCGAGWTPNHAFGFPESGF